ncbi:MAG: signal recognition particle-docking protein FtsY [Candidatus Aenigmarchaeota archaeon]|nr:signal recognition particle-docking protein FtsY [Candidatus Aenigmarchaeota archaeon]MDW8149197.1 signal recognition particle-docking protein FtsY [Candidatus Aenigmarchaeota archaeon]
MFRIFREKFLNVVSKIVEREIKEEDISKIFYENYEEFLSADVSIEVLEKIEEDLKNKLKGVKIGRGEIEKLIKNTINETIENILNVGTIDLLKMAENKKPFVIVFFGYNGSGKTTLIAKVAKYLMKREKSVCIAAADTFRAASIEQLEEHCNKISVKLIKQKYGSDPAAVIFDAINYAKINRIHFVLADTAGRMHTNKNLIEEMKKIVRVNKPDLKVLVLDSLIGNDIINQIKFFEEVGIDCFCFTKLDINDKGGNILTACYLFKKPILFLSYGQDYNSLEVYNYKDFSGKFIL